MHSSNRCLILLSNIYALAYLQSYGKQFVMSKPYSSRAFNFGVLYEPRGRVGIPLACSRSSDLLLVCLAFPPDRQWLRYETNDIANHSSGSVQESHLLPLTECGCKGSVIFSNTQEICRLFCCFLELLHVDTKTIKDNSRQVVCQLSSIQGYILLGWRNALSALAPTTKIKRLIMAISVNWYINPILFVPL